MSPSPPVDRMTIADRSSRNAHQTSPRNGMFQLRAVNAHGTLSLVLGGPYTPRSFPKSRMKSLLTRVSVRRLSSATRNRVEQSRHGGHRESRQTSDVEPEELDGVAPDHAASGLRRGGRKNCGNGAAGVAQRALVGRVVGGPEGTIGADSVDHFEPGRVDHEGCVAVPTTVMAGAVLQFRGNHAREDGV